MTIVAVYNSDGCVGRCDAHCHEAQEPKCRCICGGRYHGRGSSRAAQEALTEDWAPKIQAWIEANGVPRQDLRVEMPEPFLFPDMGDHPGGSRKRGVVKS